MSKKKRSKGSKAATSPGKPRRSQPDRPREDRPPASRKDGAAAHSSMIQPPVLSSLARGIAAAGRSPTLLSVAFLSAFVLWGLFSIAAGGLIRVSTPAVMAHLEALPPIHSLLDYQAVLAASRTHPPAITLAIGASMMILRALLLGVWVRLLLDALRSPARPWRESLVEAVQVGMRVLPAMLGVVAGFLGVVLVFPIVLGALLGQLGAIASLIAAMYFFVYAPIVAAAEQTGLRRSLQLGVRAARVRGPRHLILVIGYTLIAVALIVTTPVDLADPATPGFLLWAYALSVSFAQMGVLGALTYRWLLMRDHVISSTPQPLPRLSRPRLLSGR